ncbi:hypothetical protein BDZ94DRAFT_1269926 [Collybia nuda]|uniref:DUF6533 domain-containing protein n=1 Tax=Collybia nuda TaxID=64659 RepID=A0A9P6CAS1_9AGAR|nr:hypothetical protein BDZ94DRAFT_1269926 [Collybia nuda]
MISGDEIRNLRGLQVCNYSSMGALTFTVFEIILSIDEEVEQIWRKPWTNLKRLYLIIRIISLGSQFISTGITLSSPREATHSLRDCRMLAGFQGASSQVLMMAVQVILVLRVQALYYENTSLKYTLYGLFFAEVVAMTLLFALSMPGILYGSHCVITSFPGIASGFLVSPILFELLLFVMTMIKFYNTVREGWGEEHVLSRFLKDGVWAFALPFIMLIVNTFCMTFLSGALASVAYSWAIAIPGFAGCRLILNMSHLLERNETFPRSSAVADTLIFTDGAATDLNTYELYGTTHSSS